MSRRPNILWICTEHQRFDTIHALGNEHIRTPNLDRLVGEGVAFSHAFAQNTVCTPSRSSFLTGRYPVTTRCRQNGQDIPEDEVLITRVLRDIGYDCGLAGKLHVSCAYNGWERRIDDGYRVFEWSHGSTAAHGGDWVRWLADNGKQFGDVYHRSPVIFAREVPEREYHQTTWCFDRALAFMQEDRNGPWLSSINPFSAHDPFDYLPELFEQYDPDTLPSPLWQDGELDEDVLFGDDFYRARKIVRDALGVLEVQAKDSWKDIVREHDPGMADDLLDALEAIPRFRSTIRTLRQRQQNLTRLAGESWVTSKELDRYFKLVDEVKETWGTLEAGEGSIPDEVIRFLKQCSAGGAPLDMLTDVVTSWIADRNLDEYFSVRIGASRTPWSGA